MHDMRIGSTKPSEERDDAPPQLFQPPALVVDYDTGSDSGSSASDGAGGGGEGVFERTANNDGQQEAGSTAQGPTEGALASRISDAMDTRAAPAELNSTSDDVEDALAALEADVLKDLPDAAMQANAQNEIAFLGSEHADEQRNAEESNEEGEHRAHAETAADTTAQDADDTLADAEDARDRREQDGLEARVAKLRERLANRHAEGQINKFSRGVFKKVKRQAVDRIDALRRT
jgi:hypothetical protein